MPARNRPTQLSRATLVILCGLLGVSFVSGLGLWLVHELREEGGDVPRWASACQTLHGLVNPAICTLFGYLWFAHIRGGWKMGVNWRSGGSLTVLLSVLIVTGAGLYYAASGRHTWFTIHLLAGLLLAAILPIHWWLARRWAKQGSIKPAPYS